MYRWQYEHSGWGKGDDLIIGLGLKNTIIGGAGNDILIGLGQVNSFNPGAGENLIIGLGMKNTYVLSGGNDFIFNTGAQNIIYSFGFTSLVLQNGDNAVFYGGSGCSVFLAKDESRNVKEAVYYGGSGSEFYELSGKDTSVNTGAGGDILSITENTGKVHVRDLTSDDCVVIGEGMVQSIAFVNNSSHLYVYFIDYNQNLGTVVFDDWFSKEEYRANIFIGAKVDGNGIAGYEVAPDLINDLVSEADYDQIDSIGGGDALPSGMGTSIEALKSKSQWAETPSALGGMDISEIERSITPSPASSSKLMANANDFVQSLASDIDLNSIDVAMSALDKFSKFGEQIHATV